MSLKLRRQQAVQRGEKKKHVIEEPSEAQWAWGEPQIKQDHAC